MKGRIVFLILVLFTLESLALTSAQQSLISGKVTSKQKGSLGSEESQFNNSQTIRLKGSKSQEGTVDLFVGNIRIPQPYTLDIAIGATGRELTLSEEVMCKVKVELPGRLPRMFFLRSLRKERHSKSIYYYHIHLTNVNKGGRLAVFVDPDNKVKEWNEKNNKKNVEILTEDLTRQTSLLNLSPNLYVYGSYILRLEVSLRGGKLKPEEENACRVLIQYPDGSGKEMYLSQFNKYRKNPGATDYTIDIKDVHKGGNFLVVVDADNKIVEWNEDDNTKTFKIPTRALSLVNITSPSDSITVYPGSALNVRWEYSGNPKEVVGYMVRVLDGEGHQFYGEDNLPPSRNSCVVVMPSFSGTYRIKVEANASRITAPYALSAPIRVIDPYNTIGFKLTSPSHESIRKGSRITIAWQVDNERYSRIVKIEFLKMDKPGRYSIVRTIARNIRIISPQGELEWQVPSDIETGEYSYAFRFYLERKGIDEVVKYTSGLFTVLDIL